MRYQRLAVLTASYKTSIHSSQLYFGVNPTNVGLSVVRVPPKSRIAGRRGYRQTKHTKQTLQKKSIGNRTKL